MISEIWKPITSTNNAYSASNLGRIKRVLPRFVMKINKKSTRPGGIIKQDTSTPYATVCICLKNNKKTKLVHRLVAEAFYGKSDFPVNHKDGNKRNNNITNLEYLSRKENQIHASKNGLMAIGERNSQSKLKKQQVIEIRKGHALGKSLNLLSKKYNVSKANICSIVKRKTWMWLTLLLIIMCDSSFAYTRYQAIESIIGESASEPDCMEWVAGAIKSRGTLKGVYGLNNPYVKKSTGRDWQRASMAWENPIETKADHWLTPAELKKPTAQWYKKCKQVGSCGSHLYFDCPWY